MILILSDNTSINMNDGISFGNYASEYDRELYPNHQSTETSQTQIFRVLVYNITKSTFVRDMERRVQQELQVTLQTIASGKGITK